MQPPDTPRKGRGAISNPALRYSSTHVERVDDGWDAESEELPPLATIVRADPARSIIARNNSPDLPFSQSINPYRGCEHGCVYCLSGETPILMADGRTRPLADVRAGDWIYGTTRRGGYRHYVKTRVLAHWSVVKPAFRITLEDGTSLIAGGDHRFLTERGWKFVVDTPVGRRPHLTAGNKLMGTGGFAAQAAKTHEPIDVVRLTSGLPEQLRFFHLVDPVISRKLDIDGQVVRSSARLRVVAIEPQPGAMRLYDIATETEDFIANGVISHNCYARPTHAYLDLSPGLDFETKLFYKENAAELLTRELAHPGYVCKPITIGANTDPYQPVERRLGVTRSLIEVLARARHPLSIVTKGSLVLRDLDLLAEMAKRRLAAVLVSITTLDDATKRTLEPRAASPAKRLQIVRALADAGVPVGVLVAPVIPLVTDHELEEILARAAEAGARTAGYVLLRMPHEIKDLFEEWLRAHAPLKAEHVMSLMRQMHGGRLYDPTFGHRQRGSGPYAELLARRFEVACQRAGFGPRGSLELDTTQFRPPSPCGQLELWGQSEP